MSGLFGNHIVGFPTRRHICIPLVQTVSVSEMYKSAMIRKRCNQKEIPTPNFEVGKLNRQLGTCTKKTYRKPREQLFPKRRSLSSPNLSKNIKTYMRFKQHKIRLQNIKQMEPQQKHRLGTISNINDYWGWGEGGLNRFYRRLTSPSSSAVVHNI